MMIYLGDLPWVVVAIEVSGLRAPIALHHATFGER